MFPKFSQGVKKPFMQRECVDELAIWKQFQLWYTSALGSQLAEGEKQILDKYLPDLFGYFLVQCGCPEIKLEKERGSWLTNSRVSAKFCLDYDINQCVSGQANLAHLPIKSDSLDVIILPHVLDFTADPHQVLREAERVLIAEGHVVILGFNPWSFWNVFRFVMFWTKQPPWNARFLASSRVMDWLALLGFEVVHRQGYFHQLPFQSLKITSKLKWLENLGRRFWPNYGAGYVLVARKCVQRLTPIRPRWRTHRKVVSNGLEPINRNRI